MNFIHYMMSNKNHWYMEKFQWRTMCENDRQYSKRNRLKTSNIDSVCDHTGINELSSTNLTRCSTVRCGLSSCKKGAAWVINYRMRGIVVCNNFSASDVIGSESENRVKNNLSSVVGTNYGNTNVPDWYSSFGSGTLYAVISSNFISLTTLSFIIAPTSIFVCSDANFTYGMKLSNFFVSSVGYPSFLTTTIAKRLAISFFLANRRPIRLPPVL